MAPTGDHLAGSAWANFRRNDFLGLLFMKRELNLVFGMLEQLLELWTIHFLSFLQPGRILKRYNVQVIL